MKYLVVILFMIGMNSNKSCQTKVPYSANLYDSGDSSLVYFANVIIEDLKGNEIVRVTTGDEGRIFIPDLSTKFIIKINHVDYIQKIDTVNEKSNRKNVEIYLNHK